MNIVIDRLKDATQAYEIAVSLPDYFNDIGLAKMQHDLKAHSAFGAYDDGKLVGFVAYEELSPETIELSWLAVSPDVQGQGIGTQLVTDSLNQLGGDYKVCQVKTLSEIDPDPGYALTRKFYRNLGFIGLETIHPYPGWGEDDPCQIFVKFIA